MSPNYLIPEKESFVQLPRRVRPESLQFIGHLFASDGTGVYSTRGLLKDVDAAAFRVVEESSEPGLHGDGVFVSAYAVGADRAVYADELQAPRPFRPQDASRLRVIAPHFATDGTLVFCDGVKIAGADPGTFRWVGPYYAVDRKACYFRAARILGADPASFRSLAEPGDWGTGLSHDVRSLYYGDRPVVALAGTAPVLRRGPNGLVTGVFDGQREWTTIELETLYREAIRPAHRSVVFAEESSAVRFTEAMFAGLEDDLSLFLLLCTHKTLAALEEFTRGKKGEKAVVRAIERLNERLPVQVAVVSPTTITVTGEGVAAYRQFGPVVDVIARFVDILKR